MGHVKLFKKIAIEFEIAYYFVLGYMGFWKDVACQLTYAYGRWSWLLQIPLVAEWLFLKPTGPTPGKAGGPELCQEVTLFQA